MQSSDISQKFKLSEYLAQRAPFSILERGGKLASSGAVAECSRTDQRIQGIVRTDSQDVLPNIEVSVFISLASAREGDARCSCCKAEDMQEQWCAHAVALLLRASELGFLEDEATEVAQESTFRMNITTPREIALALDELVRLNHQAKRSPYVSETEISLVLDCSSDKLGIRLLFDNQVQFPTLLDSPPARSQRMLDTVLRSKVEENGFWDEEQKFWYVSSSRGLELILGLLQEYQHLCSAPDGSKIRLSRQLLEARLVVDWQADGAELRMSWTLPDGSLREKEGDLIGTGPYWTLIEGVLYRLSPVAARIASIFPYSSYQSLSRTQVGPILEVLSKNPEIDKVVEIINHEFKPQAEVMQPIPLLFIERRQSMADHFGSSQTLVLAGTVEFEYPTPSADSNTVYLPDRERERELYAELTKVGFISGSSLRNLTLSGDAALDFISLGEKILSDGWRIDGLSLLRQGVKFVNLAFRVDISASQQDNYKKAIKGDTKGQIDWFDTHISLQQNKANVPISMLFKNSKNDQDRWIRLDSGAYAAVPSGSVGQLKAMLGLVDSQFKLSNAIKTTLTKAQAIGLLKIQGPQVEVTIDSHLRELSKRLLDFEKIDRISTSKGFEGELRSYQADGLSWLYFLYNMQLGGILADEMGLGKTVQTLALIQFLKDRKMSKGPALVVAPTSVITNWLYEARRFAPKLKVLLLHGTQRKASFSQIPDFDLVITSYALLRLDRYDLERHDFGYVILDEAQNIKNPEAATTKAAKSIRTRHRLALSGTPTENRPAELWSLMDFLMPGYLGSLEFFRTYIEKPILETGPEVEVARFLHSKIKPFILRRTKREVEKDLPPKVESILHVEMADTQRALYSQVLEEVKPKVFEAVRQKGIRGASISILAALLRLRQICNHPNSIDALKDLPGFDSGKFTLLKDLVTEALESGRKILVFSQFREMLNIIRRWLNEIGVNYLYLDGATKNRQDIVDKFNQDEGVRLFLISLKAGGTGLNLAAADTVILYDPWWNPAVESQAVDRAHRIGQKRTVNVYRLVTENSVEQKIMELKARKSRIVDALVQNEEQVSVLNLSKIDLESIFNPFTQG